MSCPAIHPRRRSNLFHSRSAFRSVRSTKLLVRLLPCVAPLPSRIFIFISQSPSARVSHSQCQVQCSAERPSTEVSTFDQSDVVAGATDLLSKNCWSPDGSQLAPCIQIDPHPCPSDPRIKLRPPHLSQCLDKGAAIAAPRHHLLQVSVSFLAAKFRI